MKRVILILMMCVSVFTFTGCRSKYVSVTIKDNQGNEIQKVTLDSGDSFTLPGLQCDEGFYYTYNKTNAELQNIKKDQVIVVTFHEMNKICKYIIDDEVVKEVKVPFTRDVTYPTLPKYVNETTVQWHEDILVENAEYHYTYTLSYQPITFEVNFYDQNNKLLKRETVRYGEAAVAPVYDENYEVSWDCDFTNITSNLDVKGQINRVYGTIRYFDGDQELDLDPKQYKVSDGIELPDYQKDNYDFIGWFVSDISLYRYDKIDPYQDSDYVFYARFNKIVKDSITLPESTYNFTGISKIPHGSGNGTYVYQPVFPSGPSTSVQNYNWSTSDSSIATVSAWSSITGKKSGYCVLTATFKTDASMTINCLIRVTSSGIEYVTVADANDNTTYTVTFKGFDGEVIDEQVVLKGMSVFYPIPPIVENYAFAGWDTEPYNITADTTITAIYEAGANKYTGSKFAIIGDSISTYQDAIPAGYSCFYPYPTADIFDVNQTWWMQMVNGLGAGLFINNSYSGSCVGAGVSSDSQNTARLDQLYVGDEKPDYLIIYMGSNDCHSPSLLNGFKNGYKVMLDKIIAKSPNTTIILCTLPKSNLYTEANRTAYNKVITDYAAEYGLDIIDFASVDLIPYLIDSAHPNQAGMTAIAKKAIDDLL